LFDFEKGEILLVNKPYRWTSFDVIGSIRYFFKKELGIKKFKIGHAGTLDPLATGLLILCTGPATKRIEEFKDFDKEYTGTFSLGATTASFDLEKPVDFTFPTDHLNVELIHQAASKLTGDIDQVPPVFSAVKVNGKRAYKYARNEQEVELKARQVNISVFEISRIEIPEVDFRIVCSKGTYIRSIARDFGSLLESGAHLTALCRTRVGPFNLSDAWEIEGFKNAVRSQFNISPTPSET
jgi:tRNA pseudouridine55 synthase